MDAISPPTYEELVDLTRRQSRQIDELRAEVERLKAELEQSRRAGKRQAAPFSEGSPRADPKRPGRKPGHPPSHRPIPPPGQVDRTIEVSLPPDCPECHTPLGEAPVTIHDQYQIDLPEPKPVVTRFRVPVTRCPSCRRRVQGRHAEQISDALGSAAIQYGPRLLGLAADLKHRLGVSYRKCSSVLLTLTGVVVASAALVRSSHRLGKLAQPSYDRLVEAARKSAVQQVDETGWKIGGRSAWLWVFADEHATLYRIRPSRAHEVVVEVLGEGFAGVLVSDCFLAYDPLPFSKQKCLAHLLKTCGEIERSKTRAAVRFSRRVAALLRKAMALKRRRADLSPHGYAVARGRLHAELDRLLAGNLTDPDNARLAKRLRKHQAHLLNFLDHDGLDATNTLAEREIRPAVIARKLSAGNRTEAGAETHAVLASVLRTCRRQGLDVLQSVGELLRHGPGSLIPFPHIQAGSSKS
ncbi:IS66 family transposase [Paludisphaera soli]|uniref:IS66 family transposase n=1 Tax=Paludisphaera soli TaxID=2712865 RepID=UPI0013EBE0DD|nr:IS66 family transposase [Paludisphaera soli]